MSPRRIDGFATFPLKQAALGLLVAGPKHGYELYQDFGEAFSPIWKAGQSKFYAVLSDLQAAGLLDVTTEMQEDRPPRKVYHLTDAGRQTFMDWLYEPVAPLRAVRVAFIAKLRFFDLLALPDAERLIDAQMEVCRQTLDDWVQQADDLSQRHGDPFYELVYDFRRRQARFIIEWLEQCKRHIQTGAARR